MCLASVVSTWNSGKTDPSLFSWRPSWSCSSCEEVCIMKLSICVSVPFVVKQVLNYRNNFSLQWPVVYQTGMLWIFSSLSMQQAKPNRGFFSKFNTSRPPVAWFTLRINAGPEIGKGSAVQFRCSRLVLFIFTPTYFVLCYMVHEHTSSLPRMMFLAMVMLFLEKVSSQSLWILQVFD